MRWNPNFLVRSEYSGIFRNIPDIPEYATVLGKRPTPSASMCWSFGPAVMIKSGHASLFDNGECQPTQLISSNQCLLPLRYECSFVPECHDGRTMGAVWIGASCHPALCSFHVLLLQLRLGLFGDAGKIFQFRDLSVCIVKT